MPRAWFVCMFEPALTAVGKELMTEQSGQMRFGHRTRRRAIVEASVASVFGVPTILSCTPEQATELLAGRGSITFANDCEAGPTKTQFRVPAEPVNMRVSLPTKIGEQAVVEFVLIRRNDTVQLLDKWRTDVSPSWSSYCKPLPLLELLMKVAFQSIVGGNTTDFKKGSFTLLIEAYTGTTLRAQGSVTIEWEV